MEREKNQIVWKEVLPRREAVMVTRVPVYTETDFHDHNFIEIIYIDKGRGWQKIGEDAFTEVRSGDLFVLNAGVPHRLISDTGHMLVVYNCLFNPETLDDSVSGGENFMSLAYQYLFCAQNDGVAAPYIRIRDSAAACTIMKEMQEECKKELPGGVLMRRADLTRLLLTIFRTYDREISPSGEKPSLFGQMIANDTMRFLESHYDENITCAQLAERVFVSADHFGRMFKKAAGISPIQALQKLRMEKTSQLLLETDMNVTDIARQVGYSDMKHFYEVFRTHYGTTPSRYRAEKGG